MPATVRLHGRPPLPVNPCRVRLSATAVLIHTSNGQLQALNEADGLVKWTVNTDMPALSLRGESAPATAFGAAIVGGDNGRVSAVLMQQGQMIWQQRISGDRFN